MSKNDFFYIGRGFIQDHRGPHKTEKKLEKSSKKGGKMAVSYTHLTLPTIYSV